MAHGLDFSRGSAAFAYVGASPWHRLGNKIEGIASVEDMTEKAGMNWDILRSSAVYFDQHGNQHISPDNDILYRSDNGAYLSYRSKDRYKIVQPKEIVEFYRDLIDATEGDFALETAGVLHGGRKFFALARNRNEAALGDDVVLPYLLLTSSCDGSMATIGMGTTVRVVCQNTLSAALNDTRNMVRVPHSRAFDAQQVKIDLGVVNNQFSRFMDFAASAASADISDETAMDFFSRLYGPTRTVELDLEIPDMDSDDWTGQQRNTVAKLMDLYHNGPGASLPSADGTVWGAINAVTRFQDFECRARADESRLVSAQFGRGAATKSMAIDLATKIMAPA